MLLRNRNLKFISKDVYLKVINNDNKFCKNYNKNSIINLNIAHNEGNYFTQKDHLKELEDKALIPFKYCDKEGLINDNNNPNEHDRYGNQHKGAYHTVTVNQFLSLKNYQLKKLNFHAENVKSINKRVIESTNMIGVKNFPIKKKK